MKENYLQRKRLEQDGLVSYYYVVWNGETVEAVGLKAFVIKTNI